MFSTINQHLTTEKGVKKMKKINNQFKQQENIDNISLKVIKEKIEKKHTYRLTL